MPCSVIGSSAGGSSPTTGPGPAQSLFFTHGDIAAIVNGAVREQVLQGADDGGALVFGACAEQLQHEKVAKAVDSDARQAIGLAGDQAVAVEAIALGQPARQVCACCRRRSKKALSMASLRSKVHTRARICDDGE